MSAYIEFYIKANSNEYIPIGSFSRSSDVFHAFEKYAVYEKNIPVTSLMIEEIRSDLNENIERFNHNIQFCEDMIKSISTFNDSIDEKIEKVYNYRSEITDYKEIIEDYNDTLEFVSHLQFLLNAAEETKYYSSEERKYSVDNFIYMGYEAPYPGEKE